MRLLRNFTFPGTVKTISGVDGTDWTSIFGWSPVGSLENCEMYWEFKTLNSYLSSFTDKFCVCLKSWDVALPRLLLFM